MPAINCASYPPRAELQLRSTRGHGAVIQQGNEQYRHLCEQLVGRSEFAGSDYSWGDSVIK
ncbi:MAG: hypothetical protein ACRDN8_18515, partial [Thermoleophilaceae bacterium]